MASTQSSGFGSNKAPPRAGTYSLPLRSSQNGVRGDPQDQTDQRVGKQPQQIDEAAASVSSEDQKKMSLWDRDGGSA